MSTSREQIVRVGRIAGGVCLSLAGLILLILPGPGIPLLLAGLLLLERDFHWAGRLRRRLVRWLKAVLDIARRASIAARLWFATRFGKLRKRKETTRAEDRRLPPGTGQRLA